MSTRTSAQSFVTREELAELRGELAACRAEIAHLKERLVVLEGGDFEVVVSTTATSSNTAAAAEHLPADRAAIAGDIGKWIAKALRGERAGLSGRERISLQSRVYLVFKDLGGKVYNPPLFCELWREAKQYCTIAGHAANDSIFVGLPSKAEARIVTLSAGCNLPESLQR